jgi:hypothetical protein
MSDLSMSITVEGTPNPNAAKFVLDRDVPGEGSRSYFDLESATGDRLAERLLAIEGIRALLLVENFITVTKTDQVEWSELVDRVEAVIRTELAG